MASRERLYELWMLYCNKVSVFFLLFVNQVFNYFFFVTSLSTIPLLRSCIDFHGFSKGITELLTLFTTSALDLLFRLVFFCDEV